MKFVQGLCETVTRALGLSAFSSWDRDPAEQHRVGPHGIIQPVEAKETSPATAHLAENLFPLPSSARHGSPGDREEEISLLHQRLPVGAMSEEDLPPGPIFSPPQSRQGFYCDYSAMKGWSHVAGSGNRNAWLEKPITGSDTTGGIYNIFTNYDDYAPIGTVRKYHLNVTDQNINTDGIDRPTGGKVYNGQYPGPLLEACWGDWMEVTVENHLRYNGTAVHMHGARQLNAFEYDGVNAITQCAIAPGDSFTYKFRVTQYGTSWYHSHYSLQYADGLAGPLTFHGPHSADFDVALDPYLFGDWSHNSAFQDYSMELRNPPAIMRTVILNGKGFYNCTNNPNPDCKTKKDPPKIYEQVFERGRKYLLRLINTSTANTFFFSIDKHMLQVVEADFVPIEPYYARTIAVGIGQRYNVVVEASPSNSLIPVEDQNYWIRIVGAEGCKYIEPGQDNELLGIVRYNSGSKKEPTTTAYEFDKTCRDELSPSLVPVNKEDVTSWEHPANNIDPETGDNFEVGVMMPGPNNPYTHGNFPRWDITPIPMWLNYTDPTIDHIGDASFNPDVYSLVTEDYTKEDWVYIILNVHPPEDASEHEHMYIPIAHPIHLHGHDFMILAQERRAFHNDDLTNGTFNYKNPPRRDTVLLPGGGYLAIGFKTNNPGIWIMHCHIAWHASSGMAIQIRENEHLVKLSDEVVNEKDRVCKKWRDWFAEAEKHHWDAHEFQEDSGI